MRPHGGHALLDYWLHRGCPNVNLSRRRDSQLIACQWRHRRTSETGYRPKDVTSFQWISFLLRDPLRGPDESDADPDGENSIVLNTHLYDPSTRILDRPSRSSSLALIQVALHTPRKSQPSLAPPNDRVNLTHTGFTYAHRSHGYETSFRVLLPAFSLVLAFILPVASQSRTV
jgi:hypothetical protein